MKSCKISIVSSIIVGIMVCGMLAACGAAESQMKNPPAAGLGISEAIEKNIPDNVVPSSEEPTNGGTAQFETGIRP